MTNKEDIEEMYKDILNNVNKSDTSRWFLLENDEFTQYLISINPDNSLYLFMGVENVGATRALIESQEIDFYYTPKYFHLYVENDKLYCKVKEIDSISKDATAQEYSKLIKPINYLFSAISCYAAEIEDIDGDNYFHCYFDDKFFDFSLRIEPFNTDAYFQRKFARYKKEINPKKLNNKDVLIDIAYIPLPVLSKTRNKIVNLPLMNVITGCDTKIEEVKYYLLDVDNKNIGDSIKEILESYDEVGKNVQLSSRFIFELLEKPLKKAGMKVGYASLHPGELLVTLRFFAGLKKFFSNDLFEKGYIDFDKLKLEVDEIEYFNNNMIMNKYGNPIDVESIKQLYTRDGKIFERYFEFMGYEKESLKEDFHINLIRSLKSYQGLEDKLLESGLFEDGDVDLDEVEKYLNEESEENIELDTDLVS